MTDAALLGASRDRLLRGASRHPLAAVCAEGLARCGAENGTRLALLVSGGGDSMALLLLVAAIRERSDPSLDSIAVLTIDHGLRPEARDECAAAHALARELGIAEGTVKVHLAMVYRALGVRNRTESMYRVLSADAADAVARL